MQRFIINDYESIIVIGGIYLRMMRASMAFGIQAECCCHISSDDNDIRTASKLADKTMCMCILFPNAIDTVALIRCVCIVHRIALWQHVLTLYTNCACYTSSRPLAMIVLHAINGTNDANNRYISRILYIWLLLWKLVESSLFSLVCVRYWTTF